MTYLPFIAIAISIVTVLWMFFGVITDIKERLTKLETKMDLFWKMVEGRVGQMLKAPSNIEKDALLDKMSDNTLSLEDAQRLKCILETEVEDHKSNPGLTLGYVLVLTRLEQIIQDKEQK